MPTYEYVCRSCGTHVEVFQHFSDPPLTECGVCGGPLRKVYHPAGILFKGSGFYATDSRRHSGGSDGGSKKSDSASAPKSSTTKETAGSSSSSGTGSESGSSTDSGSAAKSTAKDSGSGSKEQSA
jgi:putative FmdB family regulatory protein